MVIPIERMPSYYSRLAIALWLAACAFVIAIATPLAAEDISFGWNPTGSLSSPRQMHTATLLPDGSVLIAGGYGESGDLADTELYLPDKNMFVAGPTMSCGRTEHTATLLKNGQVLVVGGQSHGQVLATAELYDPATRRWTTTSGMHIARAYHTATLLSDGRVLVAGGSRCASPPVFIQGTPPGSALDIAEIYNPATQKWTVVDNMRTARFDHTATLLKDGRVLVAGGIGLAGSGWGGNMRRQSLDAELDDRPPPASKTILADAELFDPRTDSWINASRLPMPLFNHAATLLADGHVLVTGGMPSLDYQTTSAELYDPSTGAWTPTSSMNVQRGAHTATLLSNGQVLVCGGANVSGGVLNSAELYDPTTTTWKLTLPLSHGHIYPTATLLTDGRVLVSGGGYALGSPNYFQGDSEIFQHNPNPVPNTQPSPLPRSPPSIAVLPPPVQSLPPSPHGPPTLIAMTDHLVVFTACFVILTACLVVLLVAGTAFVIIRHLCK